MISMLSWTVVLLPNFEQKTQILGRNQFYTLEPIGCQSWEHRQSTKRCRGFKSFDLESRKGCFPSNKPGVCDEEMMSIRPKRVILRSQIVPTRALQNIAIHFKVISFFDGCAASIREHDQLQHRMFEVAGAYPSIFAFFNQRVILYRLFQ